MDGCLSFRRPVDAHGAENRMNNRNVPVTKGAANDREFTRLMAGLPGMVYRASAQPPFVFDIVGEGYERILGRSLDELTVRQVAVAMLKKLGYEAEAVPDGASCRMLSLQTKKPRVRGHPRKTIRHGKACSGSRHTALLLN